LERTDFVEVERKQIRPSNSVGRLRRVGRHQEAIVKDDGRAELHQGLVFLFRGAQKLKADGRVAPAVEVQPAQNQGA
jgi:hypothetical protein